MNKIELTGSQFLAVAEVLGTFAFAVSAWIAAIQLSNYPETSPAV